ncbi:hypothetical protein PTKIN_Ptkin09bG0052700 [Pterospermum kingtungense]
MRFVLQNSPGLLMEHCWYSNTGAQMLAWKVIRSFPLSMQIWKLPLEYQIPKVARLMVRVAGAVTLVD